MPTLSAFVYHLPPSLSQGTRRSGGDIGRRITVPMASSVELGIGMFAMSSDTPYSCTRRVLVCWCVLTAGEDGAL